MPELPVAISPDSGESVIHFDSSAVCCDRFGLEAYSRVLIFRDVKVDPSYTSPLGLYCEQHGIQHSEVTLDGGESLKYQEEWGSILEHMAAADLDRSSCVVAAGGGSVGDAVGFAAAVWKRGIPWIALPTTLLAMVDAHVGGKTAIHHGGIKNVLGAIHLPRQVWVNPSILDSLPTEELRYGWAELIKSAWIGSGELLDSLKDGIPEDLIPTEDQLRQSVAVKVDVVNRDLHEGGLRRILNFGHTLGHALEMEHDLSGSHRWSHGEAVAMGMMFACHVARACGVSTEDWQPQLGSQLTRVGLPLRPAEVPDRERLIDRLLRDKKNHGGNVTLILPERPGEMVVREFAVTEIRQFLDTWVAAE
ncbi:MAG: hypothetical protein CBC13_03360 [Planctomycetia bacterium TMED53]|nr:MAG: hypothetical protein CBC13_03360 [Planctomycetia bacterium TMED53]